MELGSLKNLELDKICRICLAIKKEMRPLFGEMVAEMLMEIAKIQVVVDVRIFGFYGLILLVFVLD